MKKTKIICTIGPASMKENVIKQMFRNGMNACRINTSYSDFKQYDSMIKSIRKFSNAPIILDTEGPEIRVINDDFKFRHNQEVIIKLSVNIYKKLKKGVRFKLNDGLSKGVIVSVKSKYLTAKLEGNGEVLKNKSICFENIDFKLPILTKKDKKVLVYGFKKSAAFIALSYTRNKNDIERVKRMIGNKNLKIISKIENKEGVKNYREIIKNSDAVMVARGDLGVEVPSEKIPIIQKDIIKECNKQGVPVIVATQMMESMITNTEPTRAETSDVANAILDGSDCVMLSGETSIGRYPSLVVKTMTKICINTESTIREYFFETSNKNIVDIITSKAFKICHLLKARIICLTRSGYTARMLSRFKPDKDVIAFTNNKGVINQLMISYGVTPIYYKEVEEYNIKKITMYCLNNKLFKKSDTIIFVAGLFIKETTNTITIYKVKELLV